MLGLASAAIAFHSAAVVQIVAITILAAVPVLCLAAVGAAIFSAGTERRHAALSVLSLLLDKDFRQEDPVGAGGREHQLESGRRDAGEADVLIRSE